MYMKRIIALLFLFVGATSYLNLPSEWHYNYEEALHLAQNEHKYVLLNFSGSDWCGPCIRMHKEILESEGFQKFADSTLIMVNANFPRLKKNQLSAEQQKLNDAVADKFNAKGVFPLTLLINELGKVVKEWDGLPKETAEAFTQEVAAAIDKDKTAQ